jgi:hypothetical protein
MNIDDYPRLRLPVEQDVKIDFYGYEDCNSLLRSDVIIMEGSYGFNQLGMSLERICDSMAVSEKDVRQICDWNTHSNDKMSLVVVNSQASMPTVKGIALVPTPMGLVYKKYVEHATYGSPYRDFFYAVIFESLRRLNVLFSPKHVAIGDLIGYVDNHKNIYTSVINAIVDFLMTDKNELNHVSFVGHHHSAISKAIDTIASEPRVLHRTVEVQISTSHPIELLELIGWTSSTE